LPSMASVVSKTLGGDPGQAGAIHSEEGDAAPLIDKSNVQFSPASFAKILTLEDGTRLPQAIAHRGYKAKFPENTMSSFRGAVEVGAHAVETDIHLTKDGVAVLSHDPTLKRCFGQPDKIIDLDWDYISNLKTIAKPHQPMPRLTDLLEYLASPGNEHVWTLLDIKMDNNIDDVMRVIGEAVKSVKPSPSRPWNERVVLGIWSASFLPYCVKYLPTFPISFIGISSSYARQFFQVSDVSFNMLHIALMGPTGSSFLKAAKEKERAVFAWTVNDEKRMRWGISKALDGVVTDNPKMFLEVCEEWKKKPQAPKFTIKESLQVFQFQLLILVLGFFFFRWKFGPQWGTSVAKEFRRKIE